METGPLWYNEKAETTKRPSEIIDLTEDLYSLEPLPVVPTAQEVLRIVPSEPVRSAEMTTTVFPKVSSDREVTYKDSNKPDNSQTSVAPTATRPSIENLLGESTGTVAVMRARPVVTNSTGAEVNGMIKTLDADSSTPTLQKKDVLDSDVEMQDATVIDHQDIRSKAPTLSFLLNKEVVPVNGTGSLMHDRMNGSGTEHLSDNSENLTRRRRPRSTMPPELHSIPAEPTFDDLVQWQRKVWRACFCDWSRCGAVLDNWESLEKVLLSLSTFKLWML
jgi:hypothetical protein